MFISPHAALIQRSPTIQRVKIGRALVHDATFDQSLELLIDHAREGWATAHVVTPNAQHIVLLETDEQLRNVYRDATLVVPDGASLLLAARFLSASLNERVTGVDLFQSLCSRAADERLRVFLLGGKPGSAELAGNKLAALYPSLNVVGTYCPPHGFEEDAVESRAVEDAIRSVAPHLLFVAFGAPKQEYWIHKYGSLLAVPVCVGIGGAFEMVAGITPRAPRWMQLAGLEWLFRLCSEPRRLWKRYLIGNLQFLAVVFRQWLNTHRSTAFNNDRLETQA